MGKFKNRHSGQTQVQIKFKIMEKEVILKWLEELEKTEENK